MIQQDEPQGECLMIILQFQGEQEKPQNSEAPPR